MKIYLEYDVLEVENRLIINMRKLKRNFLKFFYSLFFFTEIIFIGIAFYLFLIYILIIVYMVPYLVIIEPERLILHYDRFFLGKKEEVIYKYKLKALTYKNVVVKGKTRLEILIKTNDDKNIRILRFDYDFRKREFIKETYLKIAKYLVLGYDELRV